MGSDLTKCFYRDKKEQFIKYEEYVYCSTCLYKINKNQKCLFAHCMNKTFIFCSNECYFEWVNEKIIF